MNTYICASSLFTLCQVQPENKVNTEPPCFLLRCLPDIKGKNGKLVISTKSKLFKSFSFEGKGISHLI